MKIPSIPWMNNLKIKIVKYLRMIQTDI